MGSCVTIEIILSCKHIFFLLTEPKEFALKDISTLRDMNARILGRGRYGVVLHCHLPALGSVAIKCTQLHGSGREIQEAGPK